MLKRLRWFGLGAMAGALGSVYGIFRLRQAHDRYVDPDQLIDTVGTTLRTVGGTVRDAWIESRDAMHDDETTLTRDYLERRPRLRS